MSGTKKTTKIKVKRLIADFAVGYPWGSEYMEVMQEALESSRFHIYPDEWQWDSDGSGMFISRKRSVINKIVELFAKYNLDECHSPNGEYCTCLEDNYDQFWREFHKLKDVAYISQDWKHLDVSFDKKALKKIGLTLKEKVSNDFGYITYSLYKN